jgi:predicted nucleic acid-binding protein
MRKSSLYVDTSVIGGCCDSEFQEWSNGLLSDIKKGKFSLFLSELSDAEVQDAPEEVKKIYLEFRNCANRILEFSAEATELADAYLDHGILTPNYRNDALHIALATVAGADVLVSLEFQACRPFRKDSEIQCR